MGCERMEESAGMEEIRIAIGLKIPGKNTGDVLTKVI